MFWYQKWHTKLQDLESSLIPEDLVWRLKSEGDPEVPATVISTIGLPRDKGDDFKERLAGLKPRMRKYHGLDIVIGF